jgi:hypothetical protein
MPTKSATRIIADLRAANSRLRKELRRIERAHQREIVEILVAEFGKREAEIEIERNAWLTFIQLAAEDAQHSTFH